MKYKVKLGYSYTATIPDANTAMNFAEIAKRYSDEDVEVKVEVIKDEANRRRRINQENM